MFIIAVLSQKGGAGKTTIACGLAVASETRNEATVLVDLDPQGSASAWNDLRHADEPIVTATQGHRLTQVLKAAKEAGAERAVIDTPPHTVDTALVAANESDLILIPCQPATADLHAIRTTINVARLAQKPAAVVLNRARVNHRVNDEAQAALQQYEVVACPVILHERIDHQHSFTQGMTAPEFAPRGAAALEMQRLEEWIGNVQNGR